ncbi:MAG: DUF1353 domain-containing protein [Hyphomicrobiaceae bacterium]|nr:DUF1353 domain-containing protein [Hyphomicrobiaceae bacterium]
MRTKTFLFLSLLILPGLLTACQEENGNVKPGKFGTFIGKVVVSWVDNGVDMQLIEKFSYVSPKSQEWESANWDVPPGTVTNGASIPAWLWTPLGSPFVGKYRRAAVVHDYFTETKSRPSKRVHYMFYTASLAGGSTERTAKYMYGALLAFGDKWNGSGNKVSESLASATSNPIARTLATSALSVIAPPKNSVAPPDLNAPIALHEARQQYLQAMLKWITEEKPTPAQIEAYVEKHKHPVQ